MKNITKTLLALFLVLPLTALAGPLVNINKADALELRTELIGVTDETAQSIVDYRDKHGGFKNLEDVLKVEGIERDFLNINRDKMHVGDAPKADKQS